MRFELRNRPSLPTSHRSHWRLFRSALVVASLALSLCALVSVGEIRAGLTASAPTAFAAASSPQASGACISLDEGERPYTQAELVYPYDLGMLQRGDDVVGLCMIPREIPPPDVAAPTQQGQVILVSRRQQWLWAYEGGQLVFATPVTTGQPDLPTPIGVYHVMRKQTNTTFYSPWPKGSLYYYAPLHINYALLFRAGGFYIHDAPWRSEFGPRTNLPLQLPDGTTQTGSHGCVDVPTSAGAWLYQWARVGTMVVIVDGGDSHQSMPTSTTRRHSATARSRARGTAAGPPCGLAGVGTTDPFRLPVAHKPFVRSTYGPLGALLSKRQLFCIMGKRGHHAGGTQPWPWRFGRVAIEGANIGGEEERMAMMHGAEPGAPGSPQNQRAAARGVRAFALVALLVCVALLGAGSLIVTALANAASAPKTSTTGKPGSGALVGDAQQSGPDIIPTCDCQSTQVSSAALQLDGVGKEILVSISKQQLYTYLDGQLQFSFLVVTGRPGLPTPVGKWHVQFKEANITFYSPWPQGSNLYYYPTHIHFALNFHDGGFYLHDSWWRCLYGPGANVPHQVNCTDEGDPPNRGPAPVTGWEYGSHGCIGMHMADAQKLYNWASTGTTVLVVP